MAQFTSSPALQARAPDVWGAMQRGAEGAQTRQMNQLKIQDVMNPQADPGQALAREKFERTKALEHGKVLGRIAGAAGRATGMQRVQYFNQAVEYARQNQIPTDGWKSPGDPEFSAWALAQEAKAGELEQSDAVSPEREAQLGRIKAAPGPEKPLPLERKLRLAGIDPNSEEGKRLILADLAGQQINIRDGENGLEISIGKGVGTGLQKKTVADIEGKLIGYQDYLGRMSTIRKKYKSKFLEWGPRISAKLLNWKAKAGMELTPEQTQFVKEIADFSRDAIENINKYIKEITGAQMSEKEADRIRLAQPDPGEGIFSGDSPPQFEAKLESAYQAAVRAQARYNYWYRQGLDLSKFSKSELNAFGDRHPLEGMDTIMGNRADEIEEQARQRNPQANDEELENIVVEALRKEFGVGG